MSTSDNRDYLSAAECNRLRRDREAGATFAALANRHSRSETTVTLHLMNRCSHDVPPVAPSANPTCIEAVREALEHDRLTQKELTSVVGFSARSVRFALCDLMDAGVVDSRPKLTDTRQDWYFRTDGGDAQ